MPRTLDSATRDALAERMRFYRDLGLTEFYRRPVERSRRSRSRLRLQVPKHLQTVQAASAGGRLRSCGAIAGLPQPRNAVNNFSGEEPAIKTRKAISAPPQIAAAVPAEERAAALASSFAKTSATARAARCTRAATRSCLPMASPTARLMFVGEGPGADEDAQGLPFVGRAGQLLNNMIAAMGLKREEVYIANVVKCRPPGNRTPEPDEANTCSPFLFRQIDVVRPQVLVALGATAATYLLGAAAAAGRAARARARVSRHAADRHLSPGVSAARSAAEEGSLGGFADCDEGAGAEGAGESVDACQSAERAG